MCSRFALPNEPSSNLELVVISAEIPILFKNSLKMENIFSEIASYLFHS